MHRLKELLEQKKSRIGRNKRVQVLDVAMVIEKAVRKFFDETPDGISVKSFKEGELILVCRSPFAIYKLNEDKVSLIKAINENLDGEVVKKIRFRPL